VPLPPSPAPEPVASAAPTALPSLTPTPARRDPAGLARYTACTPGETDPAHVRCGRVAVRPGTPDLGLCAAGMVVPKGRLFAPQLGPVGLLPDRRGGVAARFLG
jgi:hypothetical protein